jgi:hypothetical protein
MGQEFVKPGNVPPFVGEMVLTAAAKVFSNSTQVDVHAPLPFFMNPILAACQLINVSKDGEAPDVWDAKEDMRLFEPSLVAGKAGEPMHADKRRRWCDVPKNLDGRMYDTDHVWTFHIWQHLIDFRCALFLLLRRPPFFLFFVFGLVLSRSPSTPPLSPPKHSPPPTTTQNNTNRKTQHVQAERWRLLQPRPHAGAQRPAAAADVQGHQDGRVQL